MPRKKYDKIKVNYVGRFFEDLTRAMVICERAPFEEGDFHIWDSNLGIEVKASDINHEFRLSIDQIDTMRRMSGGFPFNNFFFFLFCYRNPYIRDEEQNKITSLSIHNDKVGVRNFLAENLDTLFIIDIGVTEFLLSVCRISNKSIPLHPGAKSLNIRPSYLKRLADGGWQALPKKTRPKSFDCEFDFNPDLLEFYRLKLKIVTLGSPGATTKLLSSFKPDLLQTQIPA